MTTTPPDVQPTIHPPWPRLAKRSRTGVVAGWLALAAAVLSVTQTSNAIWAFANPAPHHWDNADYLNLSSNDAWAYRYGGPTEHRVGWRGVVDSVLNGDVSPAGCRRSGSTSASSTARPCGCSCGGESSVVRCPLSVVSCEGGSVYGGTVNPRRTTDAPA